MPSYVASNFLIVFAPRWINKPPQRNHRPAGGGGQCHDCKILTSVRVRSHKGFRGFPLGRSGFCVLCDARDLVSPLLSKSPERSGELLSRGGAMPRLHDFDFGEGANARGVSGFQLGRSSFCAVRDARDFGIAFAQYITGT